MFPKESRTRFRPGADPMAAPKGCLPMAVALQSRNDNDSPADSYKNRLGRRDHSNRLGSHSRDPGVPTLLGVG
jgi:hypothetical protein